VSQSRSLISHVGSNDQLELLLVQTGDIGNTIDRRHR
jgi:hypothetical protein